MVRAKVTPGAGREKVERLSEGVLKVAVRELAQNNAANGRVRELVALEYAVPLSRVRLMTGARSSSKMYEVALVDK